MVYMLGVCMMNDDQAFYNKNESKIWHACSKVCGFSVLGNIVCVFTVFGLFLRFLCGFAVFLSSFSHKNSFIEKGHVVLWFSP